MSIPSLQTLLDGESMPMSNDLQPLPGDLHFIMPSDEEISNWIAALPHVELPPELRAQLEAVFNETINENALAGPADAHVDAHVDESNDDELPTPQQDDAPQQEYAPQQETSADIQHGQGQASFPTLENFTAPVAGLPQLPDVDEDAYDPPHPPAVAEAPPQAYAWPQQQYYMNGGPPNEYYTQPSGAPQGPAWPQHQYHPDYYANGPHGPYPLQPSGVVQAPAQGYAYPPYQQPHIAAGPSNAHLPATEFRHWQPPVQPGSTVASSSAVDGTASAEPRKRKSRQPATRKRRRPNVTPTENGSMPGKYGPYTLANASAAVMAMPVHDPKPVDISKRKTLDPHGNPLRTRRFGVMELDDSYPSTPDNLMNLKGLSPELTCVRSCDWTDQPCGLFIEMDKTSIDGHLWYWHGLKTTATPCQFEGCEDTEDMKYWGRHIEGVHFETSYQCPYCNKHFSRDDALRRHLKGCKPFAASQERAHAQAIIKLVQGYIVPAASAT